VNIKKRKRRRRVCSNDGGAAWPCHGPPLRITPVAPHQQPITQHLHLHLL